MNQENRSDVETYDEGALCHESIEVVEWNRNTPGSHE